MMKQKKFLGVSSVVRIQKAQKFGMGSFGGLNFGPGTFLGFVGNPRDFFGF